METLAYVLGLGPMVLLAALLVPAFYNELTDPTKKGIRFDQPSLNHTNREME